MEPENLNQEAPQFEQPPTSPLNQVTPLSKYLAMALFIILPFVGGWVGYTFAPEKVVEVEKVIVREVPVTQTEFSGSEQMQVVDDERVLVSRKELIENEIEFMSQFDIEVSESTGTADLYWQRDKAIKDSAVLFNERGLAVLLPYNEGWGWPFYQMTPFDISGDIVTYGMPNPCPAGCAGTGAFIGGKIEFHPLDKTLEEIVGDDINYQIDSCRDVQLNQSVTAQRCWGDGMAFEHAMVIEGSKYKYEFKNWRCQEDLSYYQADSDFYSECITLNESFKVE